MLAYNSYTAIDTHTDRRRDVTGTTDLGLVLLG